MTFQALATVYLLAVAMISAVAYRHQGGSYKQGKLDQIQSPRSFAIVYRWIQVSSVVTSIGALYRDDTFLLRLTLSEPVRYCGIAASALFLSLFLGAKLQLGRHYSPCFDSFVPSDIIHDGIYRYVRHPIYAANLGLLASIFFVSGSGWLLINTAILAAYYYDSAREEETALRQRFPLYETYLARTGMFWPRWRRLEKQT